MAIQWDTSECSVPLPQSADETKDRDLLIYLASQIEVQSLTDDTLQEWAVRVAMLALLTGDRNTIFGGYIALYETLKRWRGLTTNVQTTPRHKWLLSRLAGAEERIGWLISNAIEEAQTFAPLGSEGSA